MDSDVHQLEGQVGGELELGQGRAEEYHVVINAVVRDGGASRAIRRPRKLNACSKAQLMHDDAAQE